MKNFLRRILPYSVLTKLLDLNTKVNEILANIKIALSLPLKRKPKKLILDIHIAEHCNLNCCGCGHFSPLAEPEFYDVDEFKRDMKRTGELFGHECEEIRLMGGEPLFHPEIITLMKVARDNFPRGKICIVSNGILLPQQKDEFWQACHDNDIEVSVTRYPIHLDERKINEMVEKYDVKFQWFLNPNVKHFFYKKPVDLRGGGLQEEFCDVHLGWWKVRRAFAWENIYVPIYS